MHNNPKISIGLPVYNGENFLRRRLDSLLSQTYSNFEIIISDNASTDATQKICQEYSSKDPRIKYIRQKVNMGASWNWDFVLEQANCDFFVWAMVDDVMLPDFLEKNMKILSTNKNLVASAGKIKPFGKITKELESNPNDSFFANIWKKIRLRFRDNEFDSLYGNYEKKVRLYLKKDKLGTFTFAIFRTNELRRSSVKESFVGADKTTLLNVLKFGDVHVIDEIMIQKYDDGLSIGIINYARKFNKGKSGIIFPLYPFTTWCFKNLGVKVFFQNLDHFMYINIMSWVNIFLDILRKLKHK